MTEIERVINNRRFVVEIDFDKIKASIAEVAEEYSEDLNDDREEPISPEAYCEDCKKALEDITAFEGDPDLVMEILYGIGMKKNGWLRIGGVYRYKRYENLSWVDDSSYGTRMYMLKAKARDDSHVVLDFVEDIEKW